MRVLILGGSRYLGPRTAKALSDAGHDIAVLNRGKTRAPIPCEVTEIRGDRASTADLAHATDVFMPDAVVDSLAFDAADAGRAIAVFGGKVSRYIVISSVSAYGRLRWVPAAENHPYYSEDRPLPGATGDYARGKAEMEQGFLRAFAAEGFPATILRPSVIYGYARLLNVWDYSTSHVARIRAGKPVIVPDTGEGLIQPVHVDDVAAAVARTLGTDAVVGEAFNCAGPKFMTLFEMFQTYGIVLDRPVEVVEIPASILHAVDPVRCARAATNLVYHHAYDITKARTLLGWRPRKFERGLRETVEFLDSNGLVESVGDWEDAVIETFRTEGARSIENIGLEIRTRAGIDPPERKVLPAWSPAPS